MARAGREREGDLASPPFQPQLEDLLTRTPSDPDYSRSTLGYCDDCVRIALTKCKVVLVNQHPGQAERIGSLIESTSRKKAFLASSSFVEENGEAFIQFPNGKRWGLNLLTQALFQVNPELGVLDYVLPLHRFKKGKKGERSYPEYLARFRRIIEVGEFPLEAPPAGVIAAAYVTQVAKDKAVLCSKELLERLRYFGGVDLFEAFLEEMEEMVIAIRGDQGFILEGLKTMEEVVQTASFDEDQTRLLLDFAFMNRRGLASGEQFNSVFDPLVKLTAENRWQEAAQVRDWLLKHCADSFPWWRANDFERQADLVCVRNLKQLVSKMIAEGLNLEALAIPVPCQEVLSPFLQRKLVAEERRQEKAKKEEILELTVLLANAILEALKRKAARLPLSTEGTALKIRYFSDVQFRRGSQRYHSAFSSRGRRENLAKLVCEIADDAYLTGWCRVSFDEMIRLFRKTYAEVVSLHPELQAIPLADYLEVLIETLPKKYREQLTEKHPVFGFVKEVALQENERVSGQRGVKVLVGYSEGRRKLFKVPFSRPEVDALDELREIVDGWGVLALSFRGQIMVVFNKLRFPTGRGLLKREEAMVTLKDNLALIRGALVDERESAELTPIAEDLRKVEEMLCEAFPELEG